MSEERPLQPFIAAHEEVRRLFQELIHHPWGQRSASPLQSWQPHVDMCETAEAIIVEVEIPGVRREDIHIEVDGDMLRISGERGMQTEQQGRNYHRIERSRGRFERQLSLPISVDRQAIHAAFDAGLLTVTLPKRAARKDNA
ncbi:MAG: Hsp20/alpha crystallin family protein [Candidatus Tectimicrobiota bacterium]